MGQAKLRKQIIQSVASGPISERGLSFLRRRNFISVMLLIQRGDCEKIHAGLFCVDDLQEGFFQCLGKTYDSVAQFQEDFRAHGTNFRPAPAEDCRRRIAQGLRIRRQSDAPVPEEFSRWNFLIGPLDSVRLPEALYFCPVCDSPLPPETCQTILSCVGSNTSCYMVCEECKRLKRPCPSPEAVAVNHGRTVDMFEEMESFSLDFEEDKSDFRMALPGQVHRDATPLFLERNNDPVLAAAFALETWMNRAAGPNESITDHNVQQALEEILEARRSHAPLPENSGQEVEYVRTAAQEGLAAYAAACANRWDATAMEAYVTAGIEKVVESVKRHQGFFNRRSYIEFIAKHLK